MFTNSKFLLNTARTLVLTVPVCLSAPAAFTQGITGDAGKCDFTQEIGTCHAVSSPRVGGGYQFFSDRTACASIDYSADGRMRRLFMADGNGIDEKASEGVKVTSCKHYASILPPKPVAAPQPVAQPTMWQNPGAPTVVYQLPNTAGGLASQSVATQQVQQAATISGAGMGLETIHTTNYRPAAPAPVYTSSIVSSPVTTTRTVMTKGGPVTYEVAATYGQAAAEQPLQVSSFAAPKPQAATAVFEQPVVADLTVSASASAYSSYEELRGKWCDASGAQRLHVFATGMEMRRLRGRELLVNFTRREQDGMTYSAKQLLATFGGKIGLRNGGNLQWQDHVSPGVSSYYELTPCDGTVVTKNFNN